jgi:hypothetical protein
VIPVDEAIKLAANRTMTAPPVPVLDDDARVSRDFLDASLDAGVEASFDGSLIEMKIPASVASPDIIADLKALWESGGWNVGVFAAEATVDEISVFQFVLAAPRLPRATRTGTAGPKARIVGAHNRSGLSQDIAILKEILEAEGWSVDVSDPDRLRLPVDRVKLQIFLENIVPAMIGQADRNAVFPNPEFWLGGMPPSNVEVWAKTRHAAEVFKGPQTRHVGFTSRDCFDPSVPRERSFLHVCGSSHRKGTAALVRAWRPEWPRLTVVAKPTPWWADTEECAWVKEKHAPNVRVILDRLSDGHLRELQNRSTYHIYPSRYEGFGHALWEGLSCNAIVIAPAGPPFVEMPFGYWLPFESRQPTANGLVRDLIVGEMGISQIVGEIHCGRMRQIGDTRWNKWVTADAAFRTTFRALIAESLETPCE